METCKYHTVIEAKVLRVKCIEHGIKQVKVPWPENKSRFTAKIESRIIEWLEDASIANMGVAEKQWKKLLYWMSHSRLKPNIVVYKTIKKHLWGILNAIRLKANNIMVEARNARI